MFIHIDRSIISKSSFIELVQSTAQTYARRPSPRAINTLLIYIVISNIQSVLSNRYITRRPRNQSTAAHRPVVSRPSDSLVGGSVPRSIDCLFYAFVVLAPLTNAARGGAERTGHDRTGHDRTGHDRTGPDRTGPDQTGTDRNRPDQTKPN